VNEDFKQTVLDFINMVTTQRHREIMAQGSDILAKIATLQTSADKNSASLDTLKTDLDKVIADVSATVPAGHAAVLDTLVGPLDKVQATQDEVDKKIAALNEEAAAKIGVISVPGQGPSPGIV
jgi:hypothetical protein